MRYRRICLLGLLGAIGLMAGCAASPSGGGWPPGRAEGSSFAVNSTAFGNGQPISRTYATQAAGGENASPPLAWTDPSPEARSFAVEVVDLHPSARGWVHWMVADIPPDVLALDEGASGELGKQILELKNGFGQAGWGGPQPPPGSGVHEYRFTVVALDVPSLGLTEDASAEQFRSAVSAHSLDAASMVGTYER